MRNEENFRSSRSRLQKGSTTLFVAAVLLPVLFFLFSLSVDVGKYYTETAKIQKVVDEAALYAHRFLPYRSEAVAAAMAMLGQYESLAPYTTVSVDGDSVSLAYRGNATIAFGGFFGLSLDVPVSAYARARGTPFDALIVVDSSAYLGPALSAGASWESAANLPPADFFRAMFTLEYEGAALDEMLLTQQCFNEPFTALKRAAISSFEYLSAFTRNAVGVAVYPGTGKHVDILRAVGTGDSRPLGPGEIDFQYYIDSYNRNELCLSAAEHEVNYAGYQFPASSSQIEAGTVSTAQPVNLALADALQNTWYLNPEFVPYLRVQHSIWSLARREFLIGDTAEVLREARSQLLGAPSVESRGALAAAPLKAILIFAGDVPHASGFRFPDGNSAAALQQQLSGLRSDIEAASGMLQIRLYYVVTRHRGNDTADFEARMAAFAELLQNEESLLAAGNADRLRLQLLYADAPFRLAEGILGPMLLSGRSAVLSR